ncbi:MAG TPA: hypothetical protein VFH31_15445 [Pyrinomonadaceae bacterium]|nr:hypothetical protein [Pyrinomonadaceae bacterium]
MRRVGLPERVTCLSIGCRELIGARRAQGPSTREEHPDGRVPASETTRKRLRLFGG